MALAHFNHAPAPLEALAGTVERVTYHNAENGFAVLNVQMRGKRDLITVVGHAASVMEGEWITASGSWVSDRTHALQFKAQTMSATPPTAAAGIEKYLASGQMRGIGPAMAKRIVTAFGEATFDIIETSPDGAREDAHSVRRKVTFGLSWRHRYSAFIGAVLCTAPMPEMTKPPPVVVDTLAVRVRNDRPEPLATVRLFVETQEQKRA